MTRLNPPANVTIDGKVEMPIVGIGTWALRGRSGYDAVRSALDAGYRHIDTATAYRNEAEIGRAVRDSGIPRSEVFITTKLPPENFRRVKETINASLKALDVDQVDLWLIHWPPNGEASPRTWREVVAVRDAGFARAVGVSNYSANQVDELISDSGQAPAVNQIRWSPFLFDAERLAHSRARKVALEGYSPFQASDLNHPVLREVADAHGVSPAQVVLRWHIEHGVVAIPKSARPERIRSNLDVFGFVLSTEEVRLIDGLSRHPTSA